ncbi:MAG: hypothetical protein IRZ13_02715 [Acetobacteraceae bacterium]|nr:hypothetical protein [Acetobacteraceae bacterium]
MACRIRAGRLNALAVTSDGRTEALPQVLGMVEPGCPTMRVTAWSTSIRCSGGHLACATASIPISDAC